MEYPTVAPSHTLTRRTPHAPPAAPGADTQVIEVVKAVDPIPAAQQAIAVPATRPDEPHPVDTRQPRKRGSRPKTAPAPRPSRRVLVLTPGLVAILALVASAMGFVGGGLAIAFGIWVSRG